MQRSVVYTILFAAAICVVCGVLVSTAAVTLKERQAANSALERKRNVLMAAGLMGVEESLSTEEVAERFATIDTQIVHLESGRVAEEIEPETFDQQKATADPATSREAPPNAAGLTRLPDHTAVYRVLGPDGQVEMLVLPVEGKGLWSTLYGFLALDADGTTIRGLTFYQHGETPGLGGEVDNPRWKGLWPGRKAFDDAWNPTIAVVKGKAGSVKEDPHRVDGLSGATITSRGVSDLLEFWLGKDGFGPYLENFRNGRTAA